MWNFILSSYKQGGGAKLLLELTTILISVALPLTLLLNETKRSRQLSTHTALMEISSKLETFAKPLQLKAKNGTLCNNPEETQREVSNYLNYLDLFSVSINKGLFDEEIAWTAFKGEFQAIDYYKSKGCDLFDPDSYIQLEKLVKRNTE
ncbi:MAG: hypothetical protein V3U87_11365 [Methylococcaceae bacterium]